MPLEKTIQKYQVIATDKVLKIKVAITGPLEKAEADRRFHLYQSQKFMLKMYEGFEVTEYPFTEKK